MWKETDIGQIPIDWEVSKIGEIADVTKLAGYEYTKYFTYVEDGEVIALRALNVREGVLDLTNVKRIYQSVSDNLVRSKLFKGDILFTYVGANIGQFAIVDKNNKYHLAPNICRIRAKENCLPFFLFSYFRTKYFKENLANYSVGSSQPTMPMGNVRQIKVPIPPLSEQSAICNILSSLDEKINLLHRQNKTLEHLAETLFKHWFVEEAEESWEVGKLGDVISIYDSKRIPVSSMERAKMKTGELYPYYGAATIMDYINQYIFDGEYILMGEDGTVQTDKGFPILQMPTGKFWVNNHTHIFQANPPFSNYFIYIFLRLTNISGIITGAVQPKINQEALKRIEFVIPPKEKIKEFAQTGEQFWQKIKSNSSQILTLTQLRDSLLPKLMSGEVRVDN